MVEEVLFDVWVDFYKDSGKWYAGDLVPGIRAKLHDTDEIIKQVYEKQDMVTDPKNFHMVVKELTEIEGGMVNFIVFRKGIPNCLKCDLYGEAALAKRTGFKLGRTSEEE